MTSTKPRGNEQFMRYVQNPVFNFLCDHYFRLEIDGWHRIPDEASLLIGIHSGGALTMDAGRRDENIGGTSTLDAKFPALT
jgi:hypothetical protein